MSIPDSLIQCIKVIGHHINTQEVQEQMFLLARNFLILSTHLLPTSEVVDLLLHRTPEVPFEYCENLFVVKTKNMNIWTKTNKKAQS